MTFHIFVAVFCFTPNYFFFHSNDCSNCGKIRKNLQALINEFSQKDCETFLIDCAEFNNLCESKIGKRKPPAILLQISSKMLYYYGDYSSDSIRKFVTERYFENRIKDFSVSEFKAETEKAKKTQYGIIVYNGNNEDFLTHFLIPLSQFELSDTILRCRKPEDCYELFREEPDKEILFVKITRKRFLAVSYFKDFDSFQNSFYNFKNLFLIPFGVEFEKKVIEEMSQTIILTMYEQTNDTENEIESFKSTVSKYANRCYASIIKVYELTPVDRKIFDTFRKEIGLEKLPKLMIIEPDMETLKIQKYFYSFVDIIPHQVDSFVVDWLNRKLEPSKRSQNVRNGERYEGFNVLSCDQFKQKVFIKKQESVVLVHKNFNKDKKSQRFLEMFKRISKQSQFSTLKFFIINSELNDLPVFYVESPSFMVFSKDSWENPLVFEKEDVKKLIEIIEKRQSLTIGGDADEFGENQDREMNDDFHDHSQIPEDEL